MSMDYRARVELATAMLDVKPRLRLISRHCRCRYIELSVVVSYVTSVTYEYYYYVILPDCDRPCAKSGQLFWWVASCQLTSVLIVDCDYSVQAHDNWLWICFSPTESGPALVAEQSACLKLSKIDVLKPPTQNI